MPYIGSVQGTTKDPRIPDASATSGHVLTSDGSSWQTQAVPTELPQSGMTADQVLKYDGSAWTYGEGGGGGGSMKATASGTLSNGDKVILQNDGTVKKVGADAGTWDVSDTLVDDNNTQAMSLRSWAFITYDPNNVNKFVIAYVDSSSESPDHKITIEVGSISGTTISFGSPQELSSATLNSGASISQRIGAHFHPSIANLIIFAWGDQNGVQVVAGEVGASSITLGTQRTMSPSSTDSNSMYSVDLSWDKEGSVARRFVCIYARFQPGNPPLDENGEEVGVFSGMVSSDAGADITSDGSSAGLGTNVVVWATSDPAPPGEAGMTAQNPCVRCDPLQEGRFVIMWTENPGMPGGTMVNVCSLNSTTTITKEANRTLSSDGGTNVNWVEFLGATSEMIFVYKNNSYQSCLRHASFNLPDDFTFGTEKIFDTSTSYSLGRPLMSPLSNTKFHAVYSYDNKVHVRGFGISGTAPSPVVIANSAGASVELDTGWIMNDLYAASDLQSTEPRIMVVGNAGGAPSNYSTFTTAKIGTETPGSSNLTEENFIGISDGAYADAAEATIQLAGAVDDAQSGLTVGATYYVQPDGTLSTTAHAETKVLAGQAVSATKLLIADSLAEQKARVQANTYAITVNTYAASVNTAAHTYTDTKTLAVNNYAASVNTAAHSYADTKHAEALAADTPAVIGGQIEATANGAITDGQCCIIESDGKVTAVANSGTALDTVTSDDNAADLGVRSQDSWSFVDYCGTDNTKFAIVYENATGQKLVAKIGTIGAGDAITYGTAVDVTAAISNNTQPVIKFHPKKSNLIGVFWGDENGVFFKCGTVSGTDITWNETGQSAAMAAEAGCNGGQGATFFDWDPLHTTTNRAVLSYQWTISEGDKTSKIIACTCADDGTSITFGSEVDIHTASNQAPSTQFTLTMSPTTEGKGLVSYKLNDSGGGKNPAMKIFTVSGTTVTLGSEIHLGYNGNDYFRESDGSVYSAWNPAVTDQFVFSGRKSSDPRVAIGNVSGTSVTWGAYLEFGSGQSEPAFIPFFGNDGSNRFYVAGTVWKSLGDRYLNVVGMNINQSTYAITMEGSMVECQVHDWINNSVAYPWYATASPNGAKCLLQSLGLSSGNVMTSTVDIGAEGSANLTETNFIGVAANTVADGATVTIQTSGGVSDAQSGLTVGTKYYVREDGSLAITPGTPSVLLGTAIAATKISIADPFALPPAAGGGGGGGLLSATADGALADGDRVILKSDGKVTKIAATSSGTDSVTDNGQDESTGIRQDSWPMRIAADPFDDTKFAILYTNSGGYLSAKIGTVTAGTNAISFGTEATFELATGGEGAENHCEAEIVWNTKAANLFGVVSGNTTGPCINFGTVSGTTITAVGSGAVLKSQDWSSDGKITLAWDKNYSGAGNRFICAYTLNDQMSMAVSNTYLRCGTVTDAAGSYAVGTEVDGWDNGGGSDYPQYGHMPMIEDPGTEGKGVFTWIDGNDGSKPKCATYSLSGTTVSVGTTATIDASNGSSTSYLDWMPGTQNFIFGWRKAYYPNLIIGTVSGTTVSMGTAFEVHSSQDETYIPKFGLNPTTKVYGFGSKNQQLYGRAFSISGTTISSLQSDPGTALYGLNQMGMHYKATVQKDGVSAVFYGVNGSFASDYNVFGTATIGESGASNLTASNFLGIVSGATADGATANVQTSSSVDDAQSGLTPGSDYYVQSDGTLATTPDSTLGAILAGKAVAATKLLIADPRPPEPVKPGEFEIVADGALTIGKPVIVTSEGKAKAISSNLTTDNFIGFATATYADGATAKILTFGNVEANQSGLTPGEMYYVQNDGTLGTGSDPGATVIAGTAIAATKLVISRG